MIEKIILHLVPFNKQHTLHSANNNVLYDGNANICPINVTPYTQYCKNYLQCNEIISSVIETSNSVWVVVVGSISVRGWEKEFKTVKKDVGFRNRNW